MLAKIKLLKCKQDMYKIVGFENVLSKQDLPSDYLKNRPCFYKAAFDSIFIFDVPLDFSYIKIPGIENAFVITTGQVLNKDELSKIIAIMKRAGQRLTDIKQKKKEFTITI